MPYNGTTGSFARLYSWVSDKANGIKVNATRMDAEMDGMATALSNAVCKDGQTTPTANLPMGTYRHTGVGDASARTHYAVVGQIQDGTYTWVAGGGTADAITAAYSPVITALVDGMELKFRASATNATTTPTFSPNGLTARTIVKSNGTAVAPGDIIGEHTLRYNLANTRWELTNPATRQTPWVAGGGTADAITATFAPAIVLFDGMVVKVRASAANTTTTPTFAPNGLTARTITKNGAQALAKGDIYGANHELLLQYNSSGPRWELLNPNFPIFSQITNSLGADVLLNNTGSFFDGPSVAQGTVGTWFASGTVTLLDSAGTAAFQVKLWDGATVIASASTNPVGSNIVHSVSLSGFLANPAGNLRISVKDITSTSGKILYTQTGTAKDSTISAFRLA